jgi:TetR/AcrR family transcriptional regulator, mexJK operon transcriptional repressor
MTEREDGQLIGSFPYIPKQERAQRKRNALLASGSELFIKNGYEHTTAKEIASNAGVATGTFYRYFSDKRQLLMSLLEDKLEKIMPPEPNWTNMDPENFLAINLTNHYDQLDQLGLHLVLPELLPHDSELADVLSVARRKLHDRIHRGLNQAKVKGLTWKDLDLDTVAWSILLLCENVPVKVSGNGIKMNYYELAKVICRMVFPPEVMQQMKNGELG